MSYNSKSGFISNLRGGAYIQTGPMNTVGVLDLAALDAPDPRHGPRSTSLLRIRNQWAIRKLRVARVHELQV